MLDIVKNDNLLNTSIAAVVILSSTTGWYILDFIGMNVFWGIFLLLSSMIFFLIVKKYGFDFKKYFRDIFKNRFNIILFVYLVWTSFTYLANYGGKLSILYICKMWFILLIYLCILGYHFNKIDQNRKNKLIYKICNYIFGLGLFYSFIAICEFISNSNMIFGFKITKWQAYNPAALYGNVNGFGTYLFIAIMAGFYCLFIYPDKNSKPRYIIGTVVQMYVLFLTVARTSMVATTVFVLGTLLFLKINKNKSLINMFSKKNVLIFVITNLIMLGVVNYNSLDSLFLNNNRNSKVRSASDMLEEKNSKLFNNRQKIWQAVIKDYKEYITVGDGLEYNIVHKIDVENVISKESKGDTRISYHNTLFSYHNTLFRYFASNGLIGLLLFLCLFVYNPLKMLITMFKEKKVKAKYFFVLLFFTCMFLYMQMEEVYLGEIGLTSLITLIIMAYANSILEHKKNEGY